MAELEEKDILNTLNEVFGDEVEAEKGKSRGRKQCPSCKKYVGVRLRVCSCGNDFDKNPVEKKLDSFDANSNAAKSEYRIFANAVGATKYRLVYAAAGKCPVPMPSKLTEANIFVWCDDVVGEGLEEKKLFTLLAIDGFASQFIERDSKEWKIYESFRQKWYDSVLLESE